MATSQTSEIVSLLNLPRELRDEIFGHLVLPECVFTSSDKPDTSNLHRTKTNAKTFVDTRIYLPRRVSPSVLGVCRQLREECLQCHNYALGSPSPSLSSTEVLEKENIKPRSNILAERLGNEVDEAAERLGDHHHIRITLEAQRAQRGTTGYSIPNREELSPRFLSLMPLMQGTKRLRLVVWPGFDWWNGSRPWATKLVNGRPRIDETALAIKPDAVTFAIGKVLEHFPAVEELEIDILAHIGDISRWDLPDLKWESIQYWLDGPVVRDGGKTLRLVNRRLAGVWSPTLIEAFYEQKETRKGDDETWHVKRHGDMRTATVVSLADPGELDDGMLKTIDDEFDRTY